MCHAYIYHITYNSSHFIFYSPDSYRDDNFQINKSSNHQILMCLLLMMLFYC